MPSKSKRKDLTVATAQPVSKKKAKKDRSKTSTTTTSELDVAVESEPIRRISSENLAKLPTISPNEFTFFKLVKDGDLNGLKDFLSSKAFRRININKTDKYGFSALHHAVKRQDEDMVSLILSQPGILTYDTLLYAIQEENIRITETVLKHEDANNLRPIPATGSIQHTLLAATASTSLAVVAPKATTTTSAIPLPVNVETQQSLKDLEDFDSEFPSYFTPFLKAAQMGNPELMELFWNRNERLETPEEHHNSGCACRICKGGESHIIESYERLHLFDALTNPTYICFLSSKQKVNFDPVNYALNKLIKCRELKTQTGVFRDKYLEYSQRLEEFIKDFLSLCKTNEESELFMAIPLNTQEEVRNKYKRLEVFVGLNLVEIVAHPHSQYVVYKQWADSHWPEWQTYSNPYKLLHFVGRIFLFPFVSLMLWTGNRSPICRKLGCPASKCLTWLGSYIFFLGVLFAQGFLPQRCNDGFEGKIPYQTEDGKCNQRGAPNIGTEWVLVVYVLGFFVSMVKKHSIPWIWDSYWTWYELIQQLLLVATFACWVGAWSGNYPNEPRKAWDQYYPEILAEIFLSVAIIFSFGRCFRLIQLNRVIGPLQIGLGRMVKRLAPGVALYLVVIGSFCTGLQAIYAPYHGIKGFDSSSKEMEQSSPFGQILTSYEELFWGTFGMSGADKANIVNLGVKVNTTAEHLRHHWINESAGKLLFGSFHILGILMMFNMLVAYFTSDFDGILENADAEWKFARTQIYITYMKDSLLPPPFNIIPTVRGVLRFFEYCTHMFFGEASARKASCSFRNCCFISEDYDRDGDRRRLRAYRRLVLDLTNRYHRLLEGKGMEHSAVIDDVLEIGEEVAELKSVVEAKLRELEGPGGNSVPHTQTSSYTPKVKASHPYEDLDNISLSSDEESTNNWSRTKRLLFHKGSKGLISKLHIINPKKKGKQTDGKDKSEVVSKSASAVSVSSSKPESVQKLFGANKSQLSSSMIQDQVNSTQQKSQSSTQPPSLAKDVSKSATPPNSLSTGSSKLASLSKTQEPSAVSDNPPSQSQTQLPSAVGTNMSTPVKTKGVLPSQAEKERAERKARDHSPSPPPPPSKGTTYQPPGLNHIPLRSAVTPSSAPSPSKATPGQQKSQPSKVPVPPPLPLTPSPAATLPGQTFRSVSPSAAPSTAPSNVPTTSAITPAQLALAQSKLSTFTAGPAASAQRSVVPPTQSALATSKPSTPVFGAPSVKPTSSSVPPPPPDPIQSSRSVLRTPPTKPPETKRNEFPK